jgi:hypothetical protein
MEENMKIENAYAMIRKLGDISAKELLRRGHGPFDSTPLVHGLAAYTNLGLEGEDAQLDTAYDLVMTDMMEAVRGEWKAV